MAHANWAEIQYPSTKKSNFIIARIDFGSGGRRMGLLEARAAKERVLNVFRVMESLMGRSTSIVDRFDFTDMWGALRRRKVAASLITQ